MTEETPKPEEIPVPLEQQIPSAVTLESMKALMENMLGMQTINSVNLWYETTYLRYVVMKLLEKNPQVNSNMNQQDFDEARTLAQKEMLDKFPGYGLQFLDKAKVNAEPVPEKQEEPVKCTQE